MNGYKIGDKVVVIKEPFEKGSIFNKTRTLGSVLTIMNFNYARNRNNLEVFFEESLGLDFEHIRPLTSLEKVLE